MHCFTYAGTLNLGYDTINALNPWMLHNYLHFIPNICIHLFVSHACQPKNSPCPFLHRKDNDSPTPIIKEPWKRVRAMCVRGSWIKIKTELTWSYGFSLIAWWKDFQYQVVIDERTRGNLKKGNIQKMVAGILPSHPREQHLLPRQRPAQSNQNLNQKQISKGSYDQERRRHRNDPILMTYAHLLPILINAGEIMHK